MKKLITLCTLLLCAVVTSWGADYSNPATKSYAGLTFLDVDATDANVTVGDNRYLTYGAYYIAVTKNITTWYNCSDGKPAGNKENGIEGDFSGDGFIKVTATTQDDTNGNGGLKLNNARLRYYYVTGATSVAALVKDNGSSKYTQLQIQEVASDGTLGAAKTIDGKKTSSQYKLDGGALDRTKYYKLTFTSNTGTNCVIYQLRLGKYYVAGPVDPEFSLTATKISTEETSQIQVGNKGNLDGITLTGLESSDPTVATVSATGLITPLKVGTTTISFTASSAVADKYNATSTTFSEELTVTAPVVDTPVISPANGTYFLGDKQSVTIACTTDGAAIQYSTDGGSSWNNYTGAFDISATTTILVKATKDGYTESAQATATINKLVPAELTAVSESTTWDWTSWNKELKLTAETTPDENTTMTFSDIALVNGLTLPSGFNGNAITFKGQYPVRGGYAQNCTFRIHVTKPGTIKVEFSNTGGSNKGRWVRVTDAYRTQIGTVEAEGTTKRDETFDVVAGDVIISGVDSEDAFASLRYMSIKYTPVTSVSNKITVSGFSTYSTNYPVDLSTIIGGTAYIATGVDGGKVTLEKCEAKVPAATGMLIAGTAGDPFTINTTADATEAPAVNLFVGLPAGGEAPVGSYVFAWPTADPSAASFYIVKTAPAALGAGKAYLDVPAGGDARLSLSFGEDAGEATGISEMKSQKADGAIFNLRGQRVAQPQKGLYIMNGKKTIVK